MITRWKISYAVGDNILLFIYGISFTLLIVRELSAEEYGLYIAAFSIMTVLEMLTGGLLNLATIKCCASVEEREIPDIFYTVISIKSAILIGFTAIIFMFSHSIAGLVGLQELVHLLHLTPIVGLPLLLKQSIQSLLIGRQRLRELFFADMFGTIISIVILIVALQINIIQSSTTMLIAYGISNLIFTVSLLMFVKDFYHLRKPSINWARKLIDFGGFAFLSSGSSLILERIDGWILLYYFPPSVLGCYDAIRKISEGITRNIVNTFSYISFPDAAKAASRNDDTSLKKTYEFYSALVFLVCLPLGLILILFPNFILTLAYGDKFIYQSSILIAFSVGCFFRPFAQVGGNVLDGMGKPKWTFIFTFTGVVLVFLLNLYTIPIYGALGAAISSTAFFVINSVMLYIYLRKKIGVRLDCVAKEIVLILRKSLG